jgi:hypothetical protein
VRDFAWTLKQRGSQGEFQIRPKRHDSSASGNSAKRNFFASAVFHFVPA